MSEAFPGSFSSPGYTNPNGTYRNSQQCIWVLEEPKTMVLTFETEFDVESHGECLYDYLEVREGVLINLITIMD